MLRAPITHGRGGDSQPELVSGAEIGRRLGVSRARVSQWAHNPHCHFPRPTGRIGSSLVWRWEGVAVWARRRGRAVAACISPAGGHAEADTSSFIGRRPALAGVAAHLEEGGRLLTLTGPAGVGKTRLALEAARDVANRFPDGVGVVELASTREPAMVGRSAAAVLGVRERPGRSLDQAVVEHLRTQRMLIVLDNCEHVISGCASLVAGLLETCPSVAMIATSQEPLGLPGEEVMPVSPLPAPPPDADPSQILECESVQLFCQRAAEIRRGVGSDDGTLTAVAEICRRLDGIPLAIELAAARLTVLTPGEINRLLHDRFALLTAGEGLPLPRHRTLRGALDWSHSLLPDSERAVLRRLSVFAGSCSLEAAAAVCGADPAGGSIVDVVAGLVARSLVTADTSGELARYRLLETVRLYASERLSEAGETGEARERHARHFVSLAETAEPELTGADQLTWLRRLDRDEGNLRAALSWSLASGEAECAQRLSGALAIFWRVRGRFREGREWLEAALALGGRVPDPVKARALRGLGFMALMLDDAEAATAALEHSLGLARDDVGGTARSLLLLGNTRCLTDLPTAPALLLESAATARRAGDAWCLAHALGVLAQVRLVEGDTDAARPAVEECLETARAAAEPQGLRLGLYLAGTLELRQGDLRSAEALLTEGLEVTRQLSEPFDIAAALEALGEVTARRGDHARARAMLDEGLALCRRSGGASIIVALCCRADLAIREGDLGTARDLLDEASAIGVSAATARDLARASLAELLAAEGDLTSARTMLEEVVEHDRQRPDPRRLAQSLSRLAWVNRQAGDLAVATEQQHQVLATQAQMGDLSGVAESLEALGGLAAATGRMEPAARLLGAAAALRAGTGVALAANRRQLHASDLEAISAALGEQRCSELSRLGAAMPVSEAIAYAQRGRGSRARPLQGWGSLTRAETRVAALVTAGLSNPQIGERLFISRSTVESHLSRIFAKLGIESRTQLVRENLRHEVEGKKG